VFSYLNNETAIWEPSRQRKLQLKSEKQPITNNPFNSYLITKILKFYQRNIFVEVCPYAFMYVKRFTFKVEMQNNNKFIVVCYF